MNGHRPFPTRWLQQLVLLPKLPRPKSARETIADWLFILLRFVARYGFAVAAIIWGYLHGSGGFVQGLVLGGILGIWIQFSLGLRKGDPTHAFFVRMCERSHGRKPRLLETFLELWRGSRLTVKKCQKLTDAYDEIRYQLENCDSDLVRNRVIRKFERDTFAAMYGSQAFPETGTQVQASQASNSRVDA